MQNRSDRINFPEIDSESLWKGVTAESIPFTPERLGYSDLSSVLSASRDDFAHTPVIVSPSTETQPDSESVYFHTRERLGLITPARTPSDILRRGPLYESSDEEGRTISESASASSPRKVKDQHEPIESFTRTQIKYHQERQKVIVKSIEDYQSKMTKLLIWHKEQETMFRQKLDSPISQTGNSAPSLRRARSKVSERLYAAISASHVGGDIS